MSAADPIREQILETEGLFAALHESVAKLEALRDKAVRELNDSREAPVHRSEEWLPIRRFNPIGKGPGGVKLAHTPERVDPVLRALSGKSLTTGEIAAECEPNGLSHDMIADVLQRNQPLFKRQYERKRYYWSLTPAGEAKASGKGPSKPAIAAELRIDILLRHLLNGPKTVVQLERLTGFANTDIEELVRHSPKFFARSSTRCLITFEGERRAAFPENLERRLCIARILSEQEADFMALVEKTGLELNVVTDAMANGWFARSGNGWKLTTDGRAALDYHTARANPAAAPKSKQAKGVKETRVRIAQRILIARLLKENGPQNFKSIARDTGVVAGSLDAALKCDWFGRRRGCTLWMLTVAGEQELESRERMAS